MWQLMLNFIFFSAFPLNHQKVDFFFLGKLFCALLAANKNQSFSLA
jgi:hypothetical protein